MSIPENQRPSEAEALGLPIDIDTTVPTVARAYDYALGGKNNFEVDRQAALASERVFPGALALARHNRAFLRRGVRYLVGRLGLRQLIDIGSGLPTQGNVHEIAHSIDPSVRVVYVDIDPLVLSHARALLAEDADKVGVIVGDARQPLSILDDPVTRQYIDLEQPVGVILAGLLHHLSDDDDPAGIVATIRDRVVSGSAFLISNFLDDGDPRAKEAEREITKHFGPGTGQFRTFEQHKTFFEGLELVSPGLVYINDWHPDEETPRGSEWHTFMAGAIGRKP